ncbi:hypothetical protein WMW72_26130 [Paenibacillus filicis]|uniref:Uncharacterized protein n=1 Tax=Paenibacillus filicis TaxID=669464 RepID=A0ABU9DR85_9BACL
MIGILWDQKRRLQLEMMREPIGSITRRIYMELIAEIEMALTDSRSVTA